MVKGTKLVKKLTSSEKRKQISFEDGILLEHNKQSYIDLIDAIKKDGRACAIRATGTGKMYLALKWLKDNPNEPFVYIAPTNVILNRFVDVIISTFFTEQTEEILNKSLDEKIEYIKNNLGFNLQLYTYSKLNKMDFNEIKDLQVSRVVIDEFHRCGATKWGQSVELFLELHPNVEIMGLTATPIRPSDGRNMVDEMFNGKIASELSLASAMEQEILPIPVMVNAIYSFEDEIISLESKVKDKNLDPKKRKELLEKLKEAKTLIGKAGGIKEIFIPFVEQVMKDKGKHDIKMVVFCKDIADRDKKMHECRSWFPGMKIKKYSLTSKETGKSIEGEDENLKFTEKVIKTFEEDNSKGVKLLFAVDILNEGLHVKGIDGVVMLRSTGSNIIFLQQLGRALAVDTKRKSAPIVFDLVNNVEVLEEDLNMFKNLVETSGKINGTGDAFENISGLKIFEEILKIRAEISDIIKLAKGFCAHTFDDRIAPLVAYAEEFGSVENVKVGDTYIYRGKVCKIGTLKHSLRRDKERLTKENIKKLEAIGMTWRDVVSTDEKINIFILYVNEFGSIDNITENTKYKIDGEEYNLFNFIQQLRRAYRQNKLNEKQIEKLEELGMVWIAGGFGVDNIRVELKKFVQQYLEFKKTHGRAPSKNGNISGEFALHDRFLQWTKSNRRKLTKEEKEYLMQNGIKVREEDLVGEHLKLFVQDYLEFYRIHKRNPKTTEDLYSRWFKWTNSKNLNEEQKNYLVEHGIEFRITSQDNINVALLKFVSEYLEFCEKYGRKPHNNEKSTKGYIDGEDSLYQRWRGWTDSEKKLTKEEKEYLEAHGIKIRVKVPVRVDGIRSSCVEFVKRWEDFIKKYNRTPTETRSLKNAKDAVEGESALYNTYLEWTDPTGRRKSPTPEEIEYLKTHNIEIRKAKKKVGNVRQELIDIVEKYFEFVKKYGRPPNYKKIDGYIEGEIQLYNNLNDWKNPTRKNLNEDEIRYLEERGFKLSKPKPRKSVNGTLTPTDGETVGV